MSAYNSDRSGEHIYVTGVDGSLHVFERQLGSTALVEKLPALIEGDAGIRGLAEADNVSVSADGLFVYVTSSSADSLVAFQRDADTGLLTLAQLLRGRTGLDVPTAMAVTGGADGRVFVSSAQGGLAAFKPLPLTGPVELQRLDIDLTPLEVRRMTLEDLFIALTGEALRG